jgi:hypothetical protein
MRVLTVATPVTRNANEAMVASGGVFIWQESGVWGQAVRFVGAFGRKLTSVALKTFHIQFTI